MTNNTEFDVISPDGIPLDFESYKSEAEARQAFKTWAKRFEFQGYYSSNNGRIALDDLQSNCRLVAIENGEQITKPW